jgi:hypothetical protein
MKSHRRRIGVAALFALLAGSAVAQEDKKSKAYPGVDSKKVTLAIAKGSQWLQERAGGVQFVERELVLFAMLHAGVGRDSAPFKKLLKEILDDARKPGGVVYRAGLRAMLLSELDPAQYQLQIAECCQILVDNQSEKGGWCYGKETTFPRYVPSPVKGVATGSGTKRAAAGEGPARPRTMIAVQRQPLDRSGLLEPDNSNSQYAVLGLRACMEANVFPPRETLLRAKKYWEGAQNQDGGWSYGGASGVALSYGTMSLGALGSWIVLKHYLREEWASDPAVQKAFAWVADTFTVESNAKSPDQMAGHRYYALYALERLGIFSQRTSFGTHDWYREGANALIAQQKPDGSWEYADRGHKSEPLHNTCFAILFLRRTTRQLPDVASTDRYIPTEK